MKNALIVLIQQLLKLFFVFPIKKDRIFFSAYSGKSYSCNPKYICQKLIEEDSHGKLEIIWAFSNREAHRYLEPRIRTVKFKSFSYIYYLLTSHVVVDNVESWSILPKRKGQLVINTWHGGGSYKGVWLMRRDSSEGTDRNMLRKNQRISLYLSSSEAFTQQTLRESFHYAGDVLECGMPRNDILIHHTKTEERQIRERLGFGEDEKLVLYAPTFRSDSSYQYQLDSNAVIQALEERFGGTWVMLMRSHYYRKSIEDENPNVMDVSAYEDMQELLMISDVLITDYSSSIWDFSLMYRPAFLFTPDLYQYSEERDFYSPIEEWPYPNAQTLYDFIVLIHKYDWETSLSRIHAHHEKLRSFETGDASHAVLMEILSFLRNNTN